jgi:hypothetical protein
MDLEGKVAKVGEGIQCSVEKLKEWRQKLILRSIIFNTNQNMSAVPECFNVLNTITGKQIAKRQIRNTSCETSSEHCP